MSNTNHKHIIEGLKNLGKRETPHAEAVIQALVKSVSDDNLVQCEADGLEIPDVQLRAVSTGTNATFLVIPKKDSYVMLASIEGSQEYVIVATEIAEKVVCKIGDMTFDVTDSVIKLNGDDYAGLVKVKELTSQLNALENKVNSILQTLQTVVVPLAPSGTYPFAPLFSPITPLTNTQQTQIENKKVKHG